MSRSLTKLVILLPLSVVLAAACGGTDPAADPADVGASEVTTDDTNLGEATAPDTGIDDTMSDDTTSQDAGSDDTGKDAKAGDSGSTDANLDTKADTHTSDALPDTKPGDSGSADSGVLDTSSDTPSDTTPGDVARSDADADALTDTPDIGVRRGPAPVLLGMAGDYVMLAKTAISTVPASKVTGDLGISPAAATFITGFSMTRAGTFWTASQVVGKIYAADNDPPTPTLLTTAITDMQTAYTDAAGRPTPDHLNLGVGAIGGLILAPGLYKWTSTVTIASDVTLSGDANDTWIFQISGDLMESSAKRVKLLGGAKAKNIVWQVAGLVDLGTTSHFEGVILCKTGITLDTGATINGRLLAQTAVKIDSSAVTEPSP